MQISITWNGTTTTAEIPNEDRAGAILRAYSRAAGIKPGAQDDEKARAVLGGILKHLRTTAQEWKHAKTMEAAAEAAAADLLSFDDPTPPEPAPAATK